MTESDGSRAHRTLTNKLGHVIHVSGTDGRADKLIAAQGDLNPLSLALWRVAVEALPWQSVVDIGANYGEMVASVDLNHVKEVVAFEPAKEIRECLEATVAGLPWTVSVRPEAVGAIAGDVELVEDLDWSGRSTVSADARLALVGHKTGTSIVPMMKLDDHFSPNWPETACIKIDVEGGELAVLAGAAQTLRSCKKFVIAIEVLQLPLGDIQQLSTEFDMYLLNAADSSLVRVDGRSIDTVAQSLYAPNVYRQDALLLPRGQTDMQDLVFASAGRILTNTPSANSGKRGDFAVYTALFGQYEALQEQDQLRDLGVPLYCFTDVDGVESDLWTVVKVKPDFPNDPVRSARAIKVLGHPTLEKYPITVWADNRVQLTPKIVDLVASMESDTDLLAFEHSFRQDLESEFAAIVAGNFDEPGRVFDQFAAYQAEVPRVLSRKPVWTGLLVRRNNQHQRQAMRIWADQINRYSRRDQLSFLYAVEKSHLKTRYLVGDNRTSEWHRWIDRNDAKLARQEKPSVQIDTTRDGKPLSMSAFDFETARDLVADFSEAVRRVGEQQEAAILRLERDLEVAQYSLRRLRREVEGRAAGPKLRDKIPRWRWLEPARRRVGRLLHGGSGA